MLPPSLMSPPPEEQKAEDLVAGCPGCVSLTARVEELERKVDALNPDPIALGLMVHRNRMKKEKEGRP